jgi:hypothetical protein
MVPGCAASKAGTSKEDHSMNMREGDKIMNMENGIVYEVKRSHEKGFVILSSEDGSRTALINSKEVDLHFSLISPHGAAVEAP